MRLDKLDDVFTHSIDFSVNSFRESDLEEIFGQDDVNLKSVGGNNMNKFFMNMLDKSRNNMKASFRDICLRMDVEENINCVVEKEQSHQKKVDDEAILSQEVLVATQGLQGIVRAAKIAEKEELKASILKVFVELIFIENFNSKLTNPLPLF